MAKPKPGIDFVGVTTAFYCTDGKGNFLFHKRGQLCRDDRGLWDCGGGRLEMNLSPEENVLKELEEEYGCKGKILEQLPAINLLREHEGKRTHWISLPFIVKVDPTKVRNNEPHKIDEMGWFKLTKLPTPLHLGVKTAMKRFKKRFLVYSV